MLDGAVLVRRERRLKFDGRQVVGRVVVQQRRSGKERAETSPRCEAGRLRAENTQVMKRSKAKVDHADETGMAQIPKTVCCLVHEWAARKRRLTPSHGAITASASWCFQLNRTVFDLPQPHSAFLNCPSSSHCTPVFRVCAAVTLMTRTCSSSTRWPSTSSAPNARASSKTWRA